jgi:hypothetical protein
MHLRYARLVVASAVAFAGVASAFQVAITDLDPLRQTCSGMWKGKDTRIESEEQP